MGTMLTHRVPHAKAPGAPASPRPRRRQSGHAVRHLGVSRLSLPPRCTLLAFCAACLLWLLLLYLYLGLEATSSSAAPEKYPAEAEEPAGPPLSLRQLQRLGRARSPEESRQQQQGYTQHAFSTLISERLGLRRRLPDTRNAACQNRTYAAPLPTVSVVICFYNEHAATLLRSLTSVLERSPWRLLREVLLVDDASDVGELAETVRRHVRQHQLQHKVRLLRSEERLGLIRARLHGAAHASGEVLLFLDSHIEVNVGWLPPLLAPIAADRHTVTVPVIDVISAESFHYKASPLVRGGFGWDMHYKWVPLSQQQKDGRQFFHTPFETPAMAGGLFAMDRTYFYELGSYDEGMDIWGGENLELSFRVWMCGGRLLIVPCSRIGHVFRKRRPYDNPPGTRGILQNLLRLVLVWLDDYKEHFFDSFPQTADMESGDVSSRLELRQRLGCRPFSWYLQHVYPELQVPESPGHQLGGMSPSGERPGPEPGPLRLRRAQTQLCALPEREEVGAGLVMQPCDLQLTQTFRETRRQELRRDIGGATELCVEAGQHAPVLAQCHLQNGDQQWNYASKVKTPVYNLVGGKCLAAADQPGARVTLETCHADSGIAWDLSVPRPDRTDASA